ncbi:polymerase delta-interacting protein 2-like [Xenia sp. Carnegie-2017]|uniref:polymerase delta-interacting protein 2-like n=1 Tax=Xenia sp. Carnegie-2017 TaxID=2897299 RepID=UPI001F04B0A7|nr:polymerase delta-interacting protein 2-like [Xenia sp. Carnegie-2017]
MAVKLSRVRANSEVFCKLFRKRIHFRDYSRLAEVGRFEIPKLQGKYSSGQPFLHRIFGYRGVILFPWLARLYDRDLEKPALSQSENEEIEGLKGQTQIYYQVLMDNRDSYFTRAQVESVTFLGNEKDGSLYAIPGLDYVSHEDILPYMPSEPKPINHELFDRFFTPSYGKGHIALDTLRLWHEKNHKWLELSDVHRETTEDIRVTAIPFYMGTREMQGVPNYWWRYCIRLENLGTNPAQLRERFWKIFSLSGTLETVRGRGVVGQEPKLTPQQSAFQYSSHVSLHAPSGHMWGIFRFERQDGTMFDVRIPPFSLESKDHVGEL